MALPGTRLLMTSLAVCMTVLSLIHKTVLGKTFMEGRMRELTVQFDEPLIRGMAPHLFENRISMG